MKRIFTIRFFLTLIAIGIVSTLIASYAYNVLKGGERISIQLHRVDGLRRGSPLLSWPGLVPLGRIEKLIIDPTLQQASAVVELTVDSDEVQKITNARNSFYVHNFSTSENYLKISAPERLLTGPALVVMFSHPKDGHASEFKLSKSPLPFMGIDFESKEITVNFKRNLYQLEPGARVLNEKGLLIGQVRKLSELPDGSIDLLIVLKSDAESEKYLACDTRFYLDRAEITPEGLKGSGETFFFGPRIVAYLNRSDSRSHETGNYFHGSALAPPSHISYDGERSLVLESTFELSPDTNLVFQGSSIGYVHSCKAALDNSSFYSEIRVYPGWHNLITKDAKFSLEQKLKLKLFERTPEGIFDSIKALRPEAVIPDPKALVRPSIEVFIPPTANEAYDFAQAYEVKEKEAFFLHKEPHDDWLKWRVSRSTHVLQDANNPLPYPTVFKVRMQWKNKSWSTEPTDFSGYATFMESGLVGLRSYMSPQADPKYVDKPLFTIEDKANPFIGDAQKFSNHLMVRPARIEGAEAWPKDQIVKLTQSENLYFVPPGTEPRVIDLRRIQKIPTGFRIKPEAVSFDKSWNGLPVMVLNGELKHKMIGILCITEDPASPYLIIDINL